MTAPVTALRQQLAPIETAILHHDLYDSITDIEGLRRFMEHHVYAVWDFMSLLKSLQRELTCTSMPWLPTGDPVTRRLINEIVLGEESDEDADGVVMSHFELYLKAMEEAGANTQPIRAFVQALADGQTLEAAFETADVPAAARAFVSYTFNIIRHHGVHVQSAVFTFGREDLIPGMFLALVKDLRNRFPQIGTFCYYLERHIEVDGDHHSHLALRMTSLLCGDDKTKWQEATEAAVQSLAMRKQLWDSVSEVLASGVVR
ncbi:MAG TPA: DUF3050 domain-containing protein [Flavobacterium sp.]|nr:DUF3050 domain-containing protein [Flavobacterium sp.]